MSESNFPLSVTLKGGTGYDAPWIVVYGHTPDEVTEKLAGVANGNLIEATVTAANALRAANNASPLAPQGQEAQQQAPVQQAAPQQQNPWGQQQQAAPPQQQSGGGPQNGTPHPEGKQCQQCGAVLQFKQVNRKSDNRTFKFWSCPNGRSKGDGHTSEFAN